MERYKPGEEASDVDQASAILKGIVDVIGIDPVLAALNTRHQLEDSRIQATVIDAGESQLTVREGEVGFVTGDWHGQLTYSQVKDTLTEYINEHLGHY